jgi:hypothetical protein
MARFADYFASKGTVSVLVRLRSRLAMDRALALYGLVYVKEEVVATEGRD